MAYTRLSKMVNCSNFWTQTNALLRKNLTFQKRNMSANIRLILFPVILCVLLTVMQNYIDKGPRNMRRPSKMDLKCGCACPDNRKRCNDSEMVCKACAVRKPPENPPSMQLPAMYCKGNGSCSFKMLFTADNQSFAQIVSNNMFPSALTMNDSDIVRGYQIYSGEIFDIRTQCPKNNSGFSFPNQIEDTTSQLEIRCGQPINLWRNSSSDINNELYKQRKLKRIVSAFDFLNSNEDGFNISVYKYTSEPSQKPTEDGVLRFVNLISNAYLQFLRGPGTKMLFEFVKTMPSHETVTKARSKKLDLASFAGSMFYVWIVLLLFPVVLTSLVYEKEQKLRIMMKMHGLGDGPYWMITYGYFLALSAIYMLCFVIFGSVLGLQFFTLNDYSVQFLFYFIYINLQISMAFLLSSFFSNVKTATVTAYICVFGTGLLGCAFNLLAVFGASIPRKWLTYMELYPGFALCRGIKEFADSAMTGSGMLLQDLSDSDSVMKEVLIIMSAEWVVLLFVAYYIDQVLSTGSGKSPLFFLKGFQKKPPSTLKNLGIQRQGSKNLAQMEKADVIQEREKVEQLLLEPTINHPIVCDDLKKFYPGRDGNPGKFAVKELFLAVPRGECFGMLGPNGAGKTSFISMMIGLTKPSSGAAYVQGMDIRTHMNEIYTNMGVCPQHDLLWECLTGREHLLFYGRLKNLNGSALTQAVEASLKSLNLFHGGVADKQAGKYSGGMKRRLSVAISLIGDPKVVYMDEPSTGLDPASRKCLWNVIKHAKQNRAIILTTHSMEEADALCDRLGIFVDGSLECVGNSQELKGRYGGTYVFTMTTSSDHEKDVENLVHQLTPNAKRIYRLSGTQKFELPKEDVKIANVFQAVEVAKRSFTVFAWGLADTTLEDVFIKVALKAQAFDKLS